MAINQERTLPFLDVLIECELKQVIANSAVQSYTGDLWKGAIKVITVVVRLFYMPKKDI